MNQAEKTPQNVSIEHETPDSLRDRLDVLTRELNERRAAEEALTRTTERLRRAQQAAMLGTWDWDIQTNELVWDGVEQVHGREPGSFGGTFDAYLEDMHPEDKGRVLSAIIGARESGNDLDIEYRIILPDGDVRWVLGRGRGFKDESGGVARMAGTCQDITDRKLAQQAVEFLARASEVLSSSLEYDQTLASLAALLVPNFADWCAVYVKQADGAIERVAAVHRDPAKLDLINEYHARFPTYQNTGFGPGFVITSGQPRLVASIPAIRQNAAARSPSAPPNEQIEYLERIGTESVIVVPMVARDGTIGAMSLIVGDSGRRYTEADLHVAIEIGRRAGLAVDNARLYSQSQAAQEELRHSNETKDEFLGILSHEIRTPTTTIYGSARLLRTRYEKLDDQTRTDLINNIEEEADRLSRMIENLLAIARMDLGREAPSEPVDVFELLHRAVEEYQRRRPQRKVTVEAEELGIVHASETHVGQVVRNLVENADKYSPLEHPIEVKARQTDELIEVAVCDRGPGIAPEEIERVFESFYRSSKTSRSASGKGLGLTVCRRLLEAHNGRIWARNRDGGGLEVLFTLPLARGTDNATPNF